MIWDEHHIDREICSSLLVSYIEDNSLIYPMQIGEDFTEEQKTHMTLFLVSNGKHFLDALSSLAGAI